MYGKSLTLPIIAKKVFNLFVNLVYPDCCYYCKDFVKENKVFCKKCFDSILPVVSVNIDVTKKYKVKVFAVSDYKYPMKTLILAKGSSDIVASKKMGQLIWDMTYIKNVEFDFIVPIPLHWRRYAERGYNQAYEMAKVISKNSGKPVINLLVRGKNTKRQSELASEKRIVNLSGAFELNKKLLNEFLSCNVLQEGNLLEGKKILFVDDLFTTGSTIKFATKAISKLNPDEIIAVVACRVV